MRGLDHFIGETLDEKYRIDKLLGKGGMGAVFLATHLGTKRAVALKIIAPHLMRNREFVERFRREAEASGRLRHPNVVDVTDFGFAQADGVAYLVMEYLDGCTLARILAEEERLPLDWVVDILEQVCSAVDEAHSQGIVHRDLKPENIWLEPNRLGGYRVKVLDFGIAKLADPSIGETLQQTSPFRENAPYLTENSKREGDLVFESRVENSDDLDAATRIFPASTSENRFLPPSSEAATRLRLPHQEDGRDTQILQHETSRKADLMESSSTREMTLVGTILGTPHYMSPEQCRGKILDARSDIYSLGVITYQMLSGKLPFTGDMPTVLKSHQETVPISLRQENGRIPKKVSVVVMSALAKDPADRPRSASAFSSALRANAEGPGTLLRRAFSLYSEHFPAFLRVSLLAHIPVFIAASLILAIPLVQRLHPLPHVGEPIIKGIVSIVYVLANVFTYSVIIAMAVLIVMQLTVAPLRPVQLGKALSVLKKRWWPFVRSTVRVNFLRLLGFALLVIPGLVLIIRYSLYPPVVVVEGLQGKAVLKRSSELAKRVRSTLILIILIQISSGFLISLSTLGQGRNASAKGQILLGLVYSVLVPLIANFFLQPLFSIMTALVYLKARQIGGESLRAAIDQFDEEEVPRSGWQQLMQEKLSTSTRYTR